MKYMGKIWKELQEIAKDTLCSLVSFHYLSVFSRGYITTLCCHVSFHYLSVFPVATSLSCDLLCHFIIISQYLDSVCIMSCHYLSMFSCWYDFFLLLFDSVLLLTFYYCGTSEAKLKTNQINIKENRESIKMGVSERSLTK